MLLTTSRTSARSGRAVAASTEVERSKAAAHTQCANTPGTISRAGTRGARVRTACRTGLFGQRAHQLADGGDAREEGVGDGHAAAQRSRLLAARPNQALHKHSRTHQWNV